MSFLSTQFPYTHTSTILLPTDPAISSRITPRHALTTAISIIHDHDAMCHLNPILTSVNPLPQDATNPAAAPPPVDISKLSASSFTLTASDDAWTYYELRDSLPLLGGRYNHELTYHATMRNLMHGLESLVQAPSNVTIHGVWEASVQRRRKVKAEVPKAKAKAKEGRGADEAAVEGEEGEEEEDEGELCLVITEESNIRCGWHVAWYIKRSLEENHGAMHDNFRKLWEERVGMRTSLTGE